MIRAIVLSAGLALVAAPVFAQSSERPSRATASLTIERPLTLSSIQPMTFARSTATGSAAAAFTSGEAVVRVSGDPRRVYRVTLPRVVVAQPGDLPVETFALVSDNAGDITRSLTGRTDAAGVDRLRIRGRLSQANGLVLTDVKATIPVGVDYE